MAFSSANVCPRSWRSHAKLRLLKLMRGQTHLAAFRISRQTNFRCRSHPVSARNLDVCVAARRLERIRNATGALALRAPLCSRNLLTSQIGRAKSQRTGSFKPLFIDSQDRSARVTRNSRGASRPSRLREKGARLLRMGNQLRTALKSRCPIVACRKPR